MPRALAIAQDIARITGARIRYIGTVGGSDRTSGSSGLPFMPAASVRPGMVMATEEGGYDIVTDVRQVTIDRPVYDLDVERVHNFADGIVTHNSVYGFRGAQVANVLEFQRTYPGRRVIVLGRNYRSTSEIVTAAVACVSHNPDRAPKQLVAMRGAGGSVAVLRFASDEREAAWVADTIAWYRAQGIAGDEILVMIRNVGQGGYWIRDLTRALYERAISYRVLGSLGLYERKEVRDALGYLALIANPYDAGALRRVLGFPARGAGAKTTAALVAWARERDLDLLASCRQARRLPVIRGDRTRERLAVLGDELTRVRGLTSSRSLGHVVCEALMIRDGPVCHLQRRRDHAPRPEDRHDAERVLDDLRSLAAAAGAFEREHPDDHSLGAFVHHATGLGGEEIDGRDERVTISTIHRAKGTEAKVAFLLACEEGQLPSWRAVQQGTVEAISEERRLFYVALTCAKDRAYLCHAARRRDRHTQAPSRFLREAHPRT
jgi:DNA helicase-2/ATP-dependent DNA helicase PcrA